MKKKNGIDPLSSKIFAFFHEVCMFRAATLARTVGIFRRNLENSNLDEGTTWEQLKQEVRLSASKIPNEIKIWLLANASLGAPRNCPFKYYYYHYYYHY